MCSSSSASLRACRWLDELDEDAIRIDREHESPERALNGLGVDAEETVTRTRRALEKRVEASDLELELRRAHILYSPLERLGRRVAVAGRANSARTTVASIPGIDISVCVSVPSVRPFIRSSASFAVLVARSSKPSNFS
jgi:hypothetical protein